MDYVDYTCEKCVWHDECETDRVHCDFLPSEEYIDELIEFNRRQFHSEYFKYISDWE